MNRPNHIILLLSVIFSAFSCSNAANDTSHEKTQQVSFVAENVLGNGLKVEIDLGNSKSILIINETGSYKFPDKLNNGEYFELAVLEQPSKPNQECEFSPISGEIEVDVLFDLTLLCTTTQYTVGGTILANKDRISDLLITANDQFVNVVTDNNNFEFDYPFDDGSELTLSIVSAPDGYTCSLNNQSIVELTVNGANVDNLLLTCTFDGFNEIEFEVSKTQPFVTPPIYSYLENFELAGNTPDIIQWNTQLVAKNGDVNFDNFTGRFTFTPSTTAKSGLDAFSFKVRNSLGETEPHAVTLSIRPGWSKADDFLHAADSWTNGPHLTSFQNEVVGEYLDEHLHTKLLKLDKINHQWQPSINMAGKNIPQGAIRLIDPIAERIRFYIVNKTNQDSIFGYYEYDPSQNTTSEFIEVESYLDTDLWLNPFIKPTIDSFGNMIFIFNITNPNNVTTQHSKYYSADSGWKSLSQVNDLYLLNSMLFMSTGIPVIVTKPQNQIPYLLTYDLSGNTWTKKPIFSQDVTVSQTNLAEPILNQYNELYLSWDYVSASDGSKNAYATIYNLINDSLSGEHHIYSTQGTSASTVNSIKNFKINNTDFISFELDVNPTDSLTSLYIHHYNTALKSFNKSSLSLQSISGVHSIDRAVVDAESGTLAYSWNTGDTQANDIYYVTRKADGTWSNTQKATELSIFGDQLSYTIDNKGDYYTIIEELINSTIFYSVIKQQNERKVGPYALIDKPTTIGAPLFIKTKNGRIISHWFEPTETTRYQLCLKEIYVVDNFLSNNIADKECLDFQLPLAESLAVNVYEDGVGRDFLLAYYQEVGYRDIYTATKIDAVWVDVLKFTETTTQPVDGERYMHDIYVDFYGENNEFATILIEQLYIKTMLGGGIQTRKVFSYLFN